MVTGQYVQAIEPVGLIERNNVEGMEGQEDIGEDENGISRFDKGVVPSYRLKDRNLHFLHRIDCFHWLFFLLLRHTSFLLVIIMNRISPDKTNFLRRQ